MKMPGHMGRDQRTTQNLEVVQVREDDNLLLIKGCIPGSKGDYVIIRESKKNPKGTVRRTAPVPAGKAKAAKADAGNPRPQRSNFV